MPIPVSQFIPPPLFLTGNRKFVFYNSFCFINKFICAILLDSKYKRYHMIFVFLWLTSLSLTTFRGIYVAANDIISFFFMAE